MARVARRAGYRAEAVLVLRVWFEDGDARQLRVRGVAVGLDRAARREMIWKSVDEATEAVRAWLQELVSRHQGGAGG